MTYRAIVIIGDREHDVPGEFAEALERDGLLSFEDDGTTLYGYYEPRPGKADEALACLTVAG